MKYSSVYYFPDAVWTIMEAGLGRSLKVAFALLPIFLLIRFCQDYLQSSLQEELTLRALIAALAQGIFISFLLLFYKELLQLLDTFINRLMELLGDTTTWESYLKKSSEQLKKVKEKHPYTWWIKAHVSIRASILRKIFSWTVLLAVRTLMMHIRGYMLLFSTQVGPLAIAASILPGKLGGTVHMWFKVHLSFLAWGVTMAILDQILAGIDLVPWSVSSSIHGWVTTAAVLLMYFFIGPLTSIYLGNSLGNGFLSAGLSGTQRLYQLARKAITFLK